MMLIINPLYKQDKGNPSVIWLELEKIVFINLWHSGEAASLSIYFNVVHEMKFLHKKKINIKKNVII